MTLAGRRLAHYEITAKLGEGGMGEVWRATDTQLDRQVAIKVLPAAFIADEERLARFEREAKLLAQLHHPNIASIFGLAESDGTRALVMELVEGPTLADRLEQGSLSIEESLSIARQLAEALEEAHEKGIVHRDLKPQNVKAPIEGKVKVLDFGLAKAMDPAGAASGPSSGSQLAASPTLMQSPTLTAAGTQMGVILGTAAYMAPEQARGGAVDRRADIWAFGVILFEMLTGKGLFAEATVTDTLASVLRQAVDHSELPRETPPKVRRLLRRCLERDPRRRLRDIGDARLILDEVESGRNEEAGPVVDQSARRATSWSRLAAVGAGCAVAAFLAGWWLRPTPEPEPVLSPDVQVRQLTFAPGLESEPSFSPDGNTVAYTTDERGPLDIVLLPLSGGDPRVLVATDADDAQPAFSPDGTRIVFTSARDREGRLHGVGGLGARSTYVQGEGGDLFVVAAAGGAPAKLAERGAYADWSPDGSQIVFQSDRSGSWDLWKVPSAGGEAVALTSDPEIDVQPAWSPDGRWVAYVTNTHLCVVDAADGTSAVALGGAGSGVENPLSPAWSPDGRWIYFASDRAAVGGSMSLWRLAFPVVDPAAPRIERVTYGETSHIEPATSRDGRRLAYHRAEFAPDLWEVDLATGALQQLTREAGGENGPDPSPDGRRLAFESFRVGLGGQIGWLDLESGTRRILTPPGGAVASTPSWSPDGRSLMYRVVDARGQRIVAQELGSLAARELVAPGPGSFLNSPSWSPDGRRIAYSLDRPGEPSRIVVDDLDGNPRTVLESPTTATDPHWSADGRFLAVQVDRGENPREIWIVPAAGGEPRVLAVPERALSHPQWFRDGSDRILVVVDHENLATLSASTGELAMVTDFERSSDFVDYPSISADGTKAWFGLSRKAGDLFLFEGY